MPDLLVPLYKLPSSKVLTDTLAAEGIIIRRAFPFDLSRTRRFIAETFSESWADETEAGFARQPITCWIAIVDGQVKGFACVDATMRGMFGPTGVCPTLRGKGVGKALLLHALSGLWDMGYAYGVIAGAGPIEFYRKACGAIEIPDSVPGIYKHMLKDDGKEGTR
jgi:GNAT superfamily N-acetyltransferase